MIPLIGIARSLPSHCLAFLALLALFIVTEGKWFDKENGIVQELGPRLSREAAIVFEGEERWKVVTKRWQWWRAPDVRAVVEVAAEEDVAETVSV